MRWLVLGLCLLGCKGREERLAPDKKTYTIASHEGTTRVPELYKKASELRARNDIPAARKIYEEAIAAEPAKSMGYVGLGSCALREKNFPEARKQYLKAASLDATSSSAYLGLGSVASLEGNHQEAASFYERAVAIDETNPDAHWGLAFTYQTLGDKDKMRLHAKRFLVLAPNSMLASHAAKMLLP
jgi:tetratricopeptide (TPR) repeat protein